MTTTLPFPNVGETITTREQLIALPDGTTVNDSGSIWTKRDGSMCTESDYRLSVADGFSLGSEPTVLSIPSLTRAELDALPNGAVIWTNDVGGMTSGLRVKSGGYFRCAGEDQDGRNSYLGDIPDVQAYLIAREPVVGGVVFHQLQMDILPVDAVICPRDTELLWVKQVNGNWVLNGQGTEGLASRQFGYPLDYIIQSLPAVARAATPTLITTESRSATAQQLADARAEAHAEAERTWRRRMNVLQESLHTLARDHAIEEDVSQVINDNSDTGMEPLEREYTVTYDVSARMSIVVTASSPDAARELADERIPSGYHTESWYGEDMTLSDVSLNDIEES